MADRPALLSAALADRYVLDRELGRGGMATVYLAHDLKHRRRVALKVLHPELAHVMGADRFQREIETVARLQHPHILPVHDSGETAGQLWFTMPFVDGESLRDRLQREPQLPVELALRIAMEAARALQYAHEQGVIHRDIKPENLLLTADGSTLVADFGIARTLSAGNDRLTETGLTMGTPAYMSPEQSAGDRHLDARTDVYSLATVLYEMLAGEPPFTGATAQTVIAKRLSGDVPRVRHVRPSVPESVEQAVTRALAPLAADRFVSAAEFADALQPTTALVMPPAESGDPRAPRAAKPRIGVWLTLASALIAAVGVVVVRTRSGPVPSTSPSVIAVMPFGPTSPDSALEILGRDLVVTLSASLEGVGDLHAIEPTTILAQVAPGRASLTLDAANALSDRLGAGRMVHGSLLRLGGTVRLDLGVFPTHGGTAIARAAVTAPAESLSVLTDSAAWVVLRGLWKGRDAPTPSPAALVRRKPEAVRAFLEGERALVEGRWQAAWTAYRRAVEADSTLWLAYERYQRSREWNGLEGDSTFVRLFQEHRRDLPEPDRLLAEAESDTGGIRSSIASHRRVVERFPDFWWGVFSHADQLFHLGPLVGYDVAEGKRSLEQTLALNPRFLPGWDHLVMVSAVDGDTVRMARAVAALERLNASPQLRQGYGYDIMPMYRLMLKAWGRKGRPDPALLDTVAKELATRNPLGVSGDGRSGLLMFCGLPALEIEIDRRIPAFDPDSQTLIWSRRSSSHAWAVRGAWDSALSTAIEVADAARTAEDSHVALRLAVTAAWVGAVPWDEVVRIRGALPALARPASAGERTETAWLDGVVAAGRNDRAALLRTLATVRAGADPDADRLAVSLELLGRAGEGGRGTADSLALLAEGLADRPGDSDTYHPLLGALLKLEASRLLLQHGDTTRATRLLVWPTAASWSHVARLSWALAGLANFERARVAEAQGRREEALHLYHEFLRRHDMPVAAHRHLVTEAEGAVRRLEGRRE